MSSARKITVLAATLMVAQLIVRSWIVASGDFYWDDLVLVGHAVSPILSWDFLGTAHDGHFMPGAFLTVGVTTLIAPLEWWLPAVTLVVLQAVASIAVWHMIRTVAPRASALVARGLLMLLFDVLSIWIAS